MLEFIRPMIIPNNFGIPGIALFEIVDFPKSFSFAYGLELWMANCMNRGENFSLEGARGPPDPRKLFKQIPKN